MAKIRFVKKKRRVDLLNLSLSILLVILPLYIYTSIFVTTRLMEISFETQDLEREITMIKIENESKHVEIMEKSSVTFLRGKIDEFGLSANSENVIRIKEKERNE